MVGQTCAPGIAQNFKFCLLLSLRCWRREYIKDGKYRKRKYIFLSFHVLFFLSCSSGQLAIIGERKHASLRKYSIVYGESVLFLTKFIILITFLDPKFGHLLVKKSLKLPLPLYYKINPSDACCFHDESRQDIHN